MCLINNFTDNEHYQTDRVERYETCMVILEKLGAKKKILASRKNKRPKNCQKGTSHTQRHAHMRHNFDKT